MSNGPVAKARRSQKFLAKLSKRENPIRFVVSLPPDVSLDEIQWTADHWEELAGKLADMKKRWAKEDEQRRQERLKQILAAVEADRKAGRI